MAALTNNYRGQYKIEKKLSSSFESYWSKSGIKDDSVKLVIQAIFNLLDDDVRKRTDDDNHNQTILDRVEFRDLCSLVANTLQEYLSVEKSDTKYSTDVVRAKIKKQIQDEILSVMKDSSGEELSFEGLESSLGEILGEFFQAQQKNKTKKGQLSSEKSTSQQNVLELFHDRLEKDKIKGVDQGKKFADEIAKSDEYKKLVEKCKSIFGKKTSSAIKIQQLPKIAEVQTSQDKSHEKATRPKTFKLFSLFSKGKDGKNNGNKTLGVTKKFLTVVVKDTAQESNRNTSIISKAFHSGINLTKKSLKTLGNMIMSGFLGIFSFFGTIFRPIGKFLGGMWNAITHPLETLKSVFKSSLDFTAKLFTVAFANPANAFVFGFLAHMFVDFVKKTIWPYVQKYAITPILWVLNYVKGPVLDFVEWVKDIFKSIKPALVFISKLFKKRFDLTGEGGSDLVAKIILNLGDACGVVLHTKFVVTLMKIGARILDGLKKMADPSFMGGQLIHLPMLYRFGAAYSMGSGEGLGSLLSEDKDGNLKIHGQDKNDDENGPEYDAQEAYQEVRDILSNTNTNTAEDRQALTDTLKWSEDSLESMDSEQNKIYELKEQLRENIDTDADISKEDLKPFFKSEMFKNENFESLFYGIMKKYCGTDNFDILSNYQKYSVIEKLLDLRQKRLNLILSKFRDGNIDTINQLKNVWNEDVLGIHEVGDGYYNSQLGHLGGSPLSIKYKEEQKRQQVTGQYFNGMAVVPIYGYAGTGKFDEKEGLIGDYSDAQTNMILTTHGIDKGSELAQFMQQSGVQGQMTKGGTIVFPKTAKSVQVLTQYRQMQYNKSQANKVDNAIFKMLVQSQDFSRMFGIQDGNLSPEQTRELLDRIIPNYSGLDVSDRIKAVNNLIDIKLKDNIAEQKKLKEQVRQIVREKSIFILNSKKNTERSDLRGGV